MGCIIIPGVTVIMMTKEILSRPRSAGEQEEPLRNRSATERGDYTASCGADFLKVLLFKYI